MALTGKGMMIWKIPSCEEGNPSKIASVAKAAGFTHVLIKIADGTYSYNINRTTNIDLVPPVVSALKAQGLRFGVGITFTEITQLEKQKPLQTAPKRSVWTDM